MDPAPRRISTVRTLVVTLILVSACSPNAGEQASPDVSAPETGASDSTSADSTTSTESGTNSTSTTDLEATTTLPPMESATFESISGIDTISDFSGFTSSGMSRWAESVSGIEEIQITSTADGSEQPALWLPPGGDAESPLLVILHSWSSGYLQHAGIPYAMWAEENGWAVVAPEFRGVNDDPDALGSDLAVQDVVDAIDWATSQDGVSPDRVYAVGYSGGGMMSLLLAGRHPDKVTAVAAWGPPYDLIQFYQQSVQAGRGYAGEIRSGCGGDPTDDEAARDQCFHRSPMTHLDAAKEERVPVFIGHGMFDSLLSPRQAAMAFNQLANSEDHFSDEALEEIARGSLPEDVSESIATETFFGEGDPEPILARQSRAVWVVFFEADHEMVYEATVRWFASDPS